MEQLPAVQADHVFQKNEAAFAFFAGNFQNSGQYAGNLNHRDADFAGLVQQSEAKVETAVGEKREGVTGIDSQRRKNRRDHVVKVFSQPVGGESRQFLRLGKRQLLPFHFLQDVL